MWVDWLINIIQTVTVLLLAMIRWLDINGSTMFEINNYILVYYRNTSQCI